MPTPNDHERWEALLMKAVDGLLSMDELPEWERHLGTCDRCRRELGELDAQKSLTDALRERMFHDVVLDRLEAAPGARALQWLGWLGLLIAYATLAAFAAWHVARAPDVPLAVKGVLAALAAGATLLLARAGWSRLRTAPHDPYRKIER